MAGLQVIPDEAVEAASKALYESRYMDMRVWEDLDAADQDEMREELAIALEAAAPHLMAPILALAEQWHTQGEDDMAVSKTIQDEHIAVTLLTEGASMVENARHIRNAVAQAGVKE